MLYNKWSIGGKKMVKTQICIAVDADVAEKFKKMFPRDISAVCNEAMKRKIELASNNSSNINLMLLTTELEDVSKKADHYNQTQQDLIEKIKLIKEDITKREKQDLIKEKEAIENLQRCKLCNTIIDNAKLKVQLTDKIIICKTCYDPSNPKLIALQKEL